MSQSYKHLTDPVYGQPSSHQFQSVQELTRPHIDSFNYVLHGALSKSVQEIPPVEFSIPNGDRISLSYTCRERGKTYCGRLTGQLVYKVNGTIVEVVERNLGDVPIMVKEMGGYFIINGLEKVVRMLIMPRRNYPMCVVRPSWKGRGQLYTEFGVQMRCVRQDLMSVNMTMHYVSNGTVNLALTYQKEQFFIPVIFVLKVLLAVPDNFIYNQLIAGHAQDSFLKGCVCHMLRSVLNEGLVTRASILKYIGERFRVKVNMPEWSSDEEVALYILRHTVCIHLDDNIDKFNILIHMTRKLIAFARGQCAAENPDSTMNHEVLLPGHLYLMVLKEKMENWLYTMKTVILRNAKKNGEAYRLTADNMHGCLTAMKEDIARPMEYLLATGNVVTRTGLGLMQASGFCTVADKLNLLRYISHFRCIHRGAYFSEMRTTTARKLLPEAWGFLCPVQTPDGAPCGLLNHISASCQIVNSDPTCPNLPHTLVSMGVTPPFDLTSPHKVVDTYPVVLDGRLIGYVPDNLVVSLTRRLRAMKIRSIDKVPAVMEICLIPKTSQPSQYAGVYLFTTVARMMRPVKNLEHDLTEMVGTFEQVYLDVAVTETEIIPQVTTHLELDQASILSTVASLTPYSDFNQSPRNMYQCQMAKQTMATPCHALWKRADNKLYRLLTPQSPMVRPRAYDDYSIDEYPLGTNAIVAVISYTGYDMEDAMVISKASYERGFGHGCIYKSEVVDLNERKNRMAYSTFVFGQGSEPDEKLESDGLPPVGAFIQYLDSFYGYVDVNTGEAKVMRYKHDEGAYVEQIKILGNDKGTGLLNKVCILFRVPRNPIIGDKFASRHGQKGICSQKWPVENMPFSESGITPDILFNPHGYPSRMTIGMMIESMAGKCAAISGVCHDATPFTFSEQNSAIDHFADTLRRAGYNYYGTEQMYSGINGRHFDADIFVGVVYYQRLRHMVTDKFQVRTTGPIDNLTHQPVQGRKRQGGVRFGEMERDALVAHGSSFVLHDRLFNCSDKSLARVCTSCESLLTPRLHRPSPTAPLRHKWSCVACKEKAAIELVAVPYVFKYLIAELASINIKVRVAVK